MLHLSIFLKINKLGKIKVAEIIKSSFLGSLLIKINGKYIIYIAILSLFTFTLGAQTEIGSRKVNTIVIDPGHGGRDPGAIGRVSKEKEIVLSIAQKLGKLINQRFPEVKVMYTRSDDRFVELYQRSEIANKAKADLFISIHANSTIKQSPSGVEFWVLGLHKADENLEAVKKENAALQFEQDIRKNYGFDPNSPEGSIIMSMQQNLYLDQSIQLAKSMESRFVKEDNQLNRGSKQAGFIVLYKTAMPSVLVEVGFISNPDEEQYIVNEVGQNKIANNLANAIADYKMKYESGAIKQVSNDIKQKPTSQIATEPTVTSSKGFSSASSSKLDIEEQENFPPAELEKKQNPQQTVTKAPVSSSLDPKSDNKKIIVDDDIEKYSSVINKPTEISIPKLEPSKTTVDVSKAPANSSPAKPVSSNMEVKPNAKTIITDDEVEKKLKAKLTSTPIAEKFEKKPVNAEPKVKEAVKEAPKESLKKEIVDASLKKVDDARKTSTKLNTTTPGKIKLEESNTKVPSYMADNEIKNEIISNTKLLDKQKIVLADSKSLEDIKEPVKEKPIAKSKVELDPTVKTMKPTTGIVYKVQVKASGKKISDSDPIQGINGGLEESFENGLYKYLVGSFTSENDAKAQLEEIRKRGINDAFIVKYKEGVRIK